MKLLLKSFAFTALVGLAGATPAAAQEARTDAAETAESQELPILVGPLPDEKKSRLPQAEQIVSVLAPEGRILNLTDGSFDDLLQSAFGDGTKMAMFSVSDQIGLDRLEVFGLDLELPQAEEVARIFDPARDERAARESKLLEEIYEVVMAETQQPVREALSDVLAYHFDEAELAEIDAFISTPVGGEFARKILEIDREPRLSLALDKPYISIMDQVGDVEAKMAEIEKDLPRIRSFGELSPAERARVAELTGLSIEQIEANLASAHGI